MLVSRYVRVVGISLEKTFHRILRVGTTVVSVYHPSDCCVTKVTHWCRWCDIPFLDFLLVICFAQFFRGKALTKTKVLVLSFHAKP